MKLKIIELFVYPFEDLQCGYGRQQGNIMPSLPYIPGRVIRGGLAGWAVRNEYLAASDQEFKKMFISNGQMKDISFPICTPHSYRQSPLSLFELKGIPDNPHSNVIKIPDIVFTEDDKDIDEKLNNNSLNGPVDFLKRDRWPSEMGATLQPATGWIDQFNGFYRGASLKITLRAAHDNQTGRVLEEAGLFAAEAMPNALTNEELYYQGSLIINQDQLKNHPFDRLICSDFQVEDMTRTDLENTELDHLIFIGRRKIPAAIFATASEIDTQNDSLPFKTVETISFTSDCVPTSEIKPHQGGTALEVLFAPYQLKKKKSFSRSGVIHGFDIHQSGGAIKPLASFVAGSCIYVEHKGIGESSLRSLWEDSLLGTGTYQQDGLGRFEVNWDLHEIN